MKKIEYSRLFKALSVVAIFSLISMIITKGSMNYYETLVRPKLSPPGWLFPIVWTTIYIIFGITLYVFWSNKKIVGALLVNLTINVIWPILFFRFHLLGFSAIWLILLIASLIYALYLVYKEKKTWVYPNLLYLLWTFFAFYLNVMVYTLNK